MTYAELSDMVIGGTYFLHGYRYEVTTPIREYEKRIRWKAVDTSGQTHKVSVKYGSPSIGNFSFAGY